MLNYKS